MNGVPLNQWMPLTADGRVLWLKYSFGPGTANALAARLPDGTWMVVSPPSDAAPGVYDVLGRQAGVSVLVAPNAFHNMGQAAWRARFPEARSYAPDGAHARLAKKTPDVPYLPLEALVQRAEPVRALLPDGMKSPDILIEIPNAAGTIWWAGDQFSNNTASDQIWPLRLLSRFVGSGLGYRCNSRPELVYVRDRSAWLASIRDAFERSPPSVVVPAHGDAVADDTAQRTRRAMESIDTRKRGG